MRHLSRSISLRIVILFTLSASTVPLAGCGGDKTLKQAAESAKDIGGGTRDVIAAVGQAYDQKLISLEQKDRLAASLRKIAIGGQRGVQAIQALQDSGVTQLTGSQAEQLNKLFSDEVVSPFLQLLIDLGALNDQSSSAIRLALTSVRTAILLLSQRIGRDDVIERIRQIERTVTV